MAFADVDALRRELKAEQYGVFALVYGFSVLVLVCRRNVSAQKFVSRLAPWAKNGTTYI